MAAAARVHRWITTILVLVMAIELALALFEGQRLTAFLATMIIAVTLAPYALGSRLDVRVPAEFQLVTVLFVFAALFYFEVVLFLNLLFTVCPLPAR